jgi:hypothetical protein
VNVRRPASLIARNPRRGVKNAARGSVCRDVTRFVSPFFAVAPLPGVPILRIVRSPRAFASLKEMSRAWDDLNQALDAMGRAGYALLLDVRLVAGRNDLEFEEAFAPHRVEMERGFSRVGVLVISPAGYLQVQRHATRDRARMRAFSEGSKAIDWLCAGESQVKARPPAAPPLRAWRTLSLGLASAPPPA